MIFSCPLTFLMSRTPNTRGYIPWTMLPSIFQFSGFGCQSIQTELTTSRHRCAMNVCRNYILGFPMGQINQALLLQILHFIVCPNKYYHRNFDVAPICWYPYFSIAAWSFTDVTVATSNGTNSAHDFFPICMLVGANSLSLILLVV